MVFYAQPSITVISGRWVYPGEKEKKNFLDLPRRKRKERKRKKKKKKKKRRRKKRKKKREANLNFHQWKDWLVRI